MIERKNPLRYPLILVTIVFIIYFIGFRLELEKTIELENQIEILKKQIK